jgi:hypothetical protein
MNSPDEKQIAPSKKPYTRPVIHVYGSIRTITENVGSMTKTDGGGAPKTKTA